MADNNTTTLNIILHNHNWTIRMMFGNYQPSPQQTSRLATCCYYYVSQSQSHNVKALKTSFYCDARVALPSPSVSQNNLKLNAMWVVGVTPLEHSQADRQTLTNSVFSSESYLYICMRVSKECFRYCFHSVSVSFFRNYWEIKSVVAPSLLWWVELNSRQELRGPDLLRSGLVLSFPRTTPDPQSPHSETYSRPGFSSR